MDNDDPKAISIGNLVWKLPLFDNPFLSMQGQNVLLVDVYLRDLEKDLLAELIAREADASAGHTFGISPQSDVDLCDI